MFSKSDLRKLIIPLIIEQTLAISVGMIDTFMVTSAGEAAVSGVSLVDTINVLIINIFAAIATGGAIVVGQYLGAKNKAQAKHAARQLMVTTFLISLFIGLICLGLNNVILHLFFGEVTVDVMQQARIYFYITAISFPFIALYNSAATLFRSSGDSQTAMKTSLVMNVVNIIGNALFIYGFHLGVIGAAISTLISRIFAACFMLWLLKNPQLDIRVTNYSPHGLDFSMVKQIMQIGLPNGVENSMFQVGKIILTRLMIIHGTAAIAGNAVASSLMSVEVIPGTAIGFAMLTVVSQCVGAKELEQARSYTKKLLVLSYIGLACLNIPVLFGLKTLLGFYNLSIDAATIATHILLVHGVSAFILFTPSFTLANAFRAAGDVKYPMWVSIFSMFVFRIGAAYFFTYVLKLGPVSIWLGMSVDWLVRSALFVIRFINGKWLQFVNR